MKINIRVIAGAKQSKITILPNGDLKIYTNAVPENGNANAAVIKLLSDYFGTPKSNIKLVRGGNIRDKVIEIQN